MNGIVEKNDIEKITKWRKYLFRAAIWLLIAGVALGGITILVADLDTVGEILGKTVGTIFLASLAMMVSVIGFRMIETGKKVTQVFSILGIGAGILSILLWVISIWAWRPVFYACVTNEGACAEWVNERNYTQRKYGYSMRYELDDCPSYVKEDCNLTWMFKLTMMLTFLGLFGLVAAGIMRMYEGQKRDLIRPLKIAAVILAGYVCFYGCLAAATGMMTGEADFTGAIKDLMGRLGMLAGFASIVWILVFLVAFVISHIEKNRDGVKKKDEVGTGSSGAKGLVTDSKVVAGSSATDKTSEDGNVIEGAQPKARVKSDEELRAEVEEQVRREMIEKEVREKLEREQREKMESEQAEKKGAQEMDDMKDVDEREEKNTSEEASFSELSNDEGADDGYDEDSLKNDENSGKIE